MLPYFVLAIEISCFIVSLFIFRRKAVPPSLRFFPLFLFITVIVECIGTWLRSGMKGMPMHNYFTAFEFLFYFYVLSQIISNAKVKRMVTYASIIYPIAVIIYVMSQPPYVFHSVTYMLGAGITVYLTIHRLYELFKLPSFKQTLNDPTFWICIGLLVFYGCTLPYFALWNMDMGYLRPVIVNVIIGVTNYVLYSSFIVAFICFLKEKRHISH